MPKAVNVRQARAQLGLLLDRVESGERVVVTRRGKAVAQIIPMERSQADWPNFKAIRARINVGGTPMSELVCKMRREARY